MHELVWERVEDCLSRAKVFGGWLVKHCDRGPVKVYYTWTHTMTFIPDPEHIWGTKEDPTAPEYALVEELPMDGSAVTLKTPPQGSITVDQIKSLRKEIGCGILEAKRLAEILNERGALTWGHVHNTCGMV